MDAKELRIGNYVEHNSEWSYRNEKGIIEWSESDWYALGECTLFLENILPIPLTEEWLLKFGFERNILEAKHNSIIYYSENNIGIKGMLGTVKPSVCKYVHQLQNLYFALTGEELTIIDL